LCSIADDGNCAAWPMTICAALPMITVHSRATIDSEEPQQLEHLGQRIPQHERGCTGG